MKGKGPKVKALCLVGAWQAKTGKEPDEEVKRLLKKIAEP